ncbi:MAG: ABC transporter permease/substrate-binding protein, partial [Myxococcota bacterium]
MSEELALLPGYLLAHLELTLVALLLGALGSIPVGILVTRRRQLEGPVLGVASVVQTIPSLALLAIMVPTLAFAGALLERGFGVSLHSIGYLPALIALTLYSTLPILRNTVAGVEGVDPAVLEAARGVGMTERQQLLRVELPLALPVIVAGIRTAAVWVVGTATLSTPVGATSLGNFIFSGLQTRNFRAVLVGCVASAGLALVLDQLIRLLELGMRGRRLALAVSAAGLIGLYAVTGLAWVRDTILEPDGGLAVGSKTFTEQYVLSEILARTLEEETGSPARALQSLGSTVLFDALRSGEVDVYVDYSGTIWATIMHRSGPPPGREQVLEEVREYLWSRHQITLAAALGFENTYALAMREDRARALGVAAISDLALRSSTLEIGGDYEFFARPEWEALRSTYQLRFRDERSMDPSLMYQAVVAGEVDVISAFSTDGRIEAFGLTVLEDDRAVIPPYDAIVLVGPNLARDAPAALAALGRLEGRIDAPTMRRMNLAV